MSVSGEVNTRTAPELASTLARICPGATDIILDLGQVTFIDSSGLRALLTAKAVCAEHCVELVLAASAQPVRSRGLDAGGGVEGEQLAWLDPEAPRVGCGPRGAGMVPPAEGR